MSMRAGKVEYCRVEDTEEHVTKNTQLLQLRDYEMLTIHSSVWREQISVSTPIMTAATESPEDRC